MTSSVLLAACTALFAGSLAQRVTGLGFALVSAPFLVILLGPQAGVVLINIMGLLTSLLVLFQVRRDIDWRLFLWLVIPAFVGIVPGSLLSLGMPAAPLEIGIGLLLVAALLLSVLAQRISITADGPGARIIAGFVSGVTNSAAGTGGPPISVYAVLSRWPQRSFVATVQPYFLAIGLLTVVTKVSVEPGLWPVHPWWAWAALIVAVLLGTSFGGLLVRRIPHRFARNAMLLLAFLGSVSVAVHGISSLR